jgi:hypothetical protein
MGKLVMKTHTLRCLTLIILMGFGLNGCKPVTLKAVSSPDQKLARSIPKDKITVGDGKQVDALRTFGNYKTYDSEDELFQFADLVVIGKPTVNLDETSYNLSSESESKSKKHQDNVSITVKDASGRSIDSYSIILFKVQKYLKGNSKNKQIRVLQSATYIQEPGRSPFVRISEGASPLQKKSRYILFLKEVDTATYPNLTGVYSIISENQGKFNLDKTDSQESEVEGREEQYRKLKEKVKKRHESDFNSTPDT